MDNSCEKIKTALVVGAAGGMGRAVCASLILAGWKVFGLDVAENAPEWLDISYIRTDIRDAASIEAAREAVSEETERLDAIVYLAGVYDLNSLVEMPEKDFVRIFDINVFGVYRINKAFLPLLGEGSRIVITSSELAPLDPLPFNGIYGITKATIEKYIFSLRMELQLLGIKVIGLRPGAVRTGLLNVSLNRIEAFVEGTEHYKVQAGRFMKIVNSVESRSISAEKLAGKVMKALAARNPKYIYKINRNPLLLILNALPDRLQTWIIRMILTK